MSPWQPTIGLALHGNHLWLSLATRITSPSMQLDWFSHPIAYSSSYEYPLYPCVSCGWTTVGIPG